MNELIYDILIKLFAPGGDVSNLFKNLGLNQKQILTAIGKIRYYFINNNFKNTRASYPALALKVAQDMGNTALKSAIVKLLFFLEGLKDSKYYTAHKSLTSNVTAQDIQKAYSELSNEQTAEFKDEIKRRLEDTKDELKDKLPWWLNPKYIAPIAGILGVGYAINAFSGIARPFGKSYKKNPSSLGKHIYRLFMGRDPKKTIIESVENFEDWAHVGEVLDIAYSSDKWDERENYRHEFKKPPRMLVSGKGDMILIKGGNLKVTSRGITG